MFRVGDAPTGTIIVEANWHNNPWFPRELEQERVDCQKNNPDNYEHIWEGGYISVVDGAYFASHLNAARKEGRIGFVAPDPLMSFHAYWDIGGTGARADACAIWIAQHIGQEIRYLDHYEAVGQPLDAHVNWLRSKGYTADRATMWLPHDGKTHDRVYAVSYESALKQAGYEVTVVPNQGRGAASARVEAARRMFPRMRFDAEKCSAGLDALGWYHEKKDEARGIGLGPEHDWSSHSADAFGLSAVAYKEPNIVKRKPLNFQGWG
jgi:phage terminase large subunit